MGLQQKMLQGVVKIIFCCKFVSAFNGAHVCLHPVMVTEG